MAKKKVTAASTSALAERAMIVRKNISRWMGGMTDRKTANEVTSAKKAHGKSLNVWKLLVPREAFAEIDRALGEGDRLHKMRTLPWSDGGYRILSADGYFAYMEEQRRCRELFERAVEAFCDRAFPTDGEESLFDIGKKRLGELAREAEYPANRRELARRFAYNVQVLPLPQASDFRVALGDTDVAAVRQQIEEQQQAAMQEAMREPFQRLHQVVSHMVERLNAYHVDKAGKAHNSFRNSLVENIRELIGLMPALNITGDAKLTALAAEAEKALLVNPEVLRDDERQRKTTAAEAEKILKKLEAFI